MAATNIVAFQPSTTNGRPVEVSSTNPLPTTGSGESFTGVVAEKFFVATSQTITRQANVTPYTALDAVNDNATAGSATAFSFTVSRRNDDPVTLERLRIFTTDTGVTGKRFRAWFFRASPTIAAGDNLKFSVAQQTLIGTMTGTFLQNDSDASAAISDGGVCFLTPDNGARIICLPTSGGETVFMLLQTLDAFTPSANSTTFIGIVEGFQGHA